MMTALGARPVNLRKGFAARNGVMRCSALNESAELIDRIAPGAPVSAVLGKIVSSWGSS
jgi:hypothetical protein